MSKWIASARFQELLGPLYAAHMLPTRVPEGKITSADWGKDIPPDLPDGFVRRTYRVSDDSVYLFGQPYIVAWMYKGAIYSGASHFYKWHCYGPMMIMAGDEEGNDYGLDAKILRNIVTFVGESQDTWCSRYHRCDAKQETPSEDEQIPTHFQSLGDLIAKITGEAKEPPKGST